MFLKYSDDALSACFKKRIFFSCIEFKNQEIPKPTKPNGTEKSKAIASAHVANANQPPQGHDPYVAIDNKIPQA